MRILVTGAGMLRLILLCFVVGIVLGVYFSGVGSSEPVPPPSVDHSVDSVGPLNDAVRGMERFAAAARRFD